ncbi:MAG: sulfotransferase [Acidimicrobiia bacterium]|nr:sulfotransferase [Acidimicrobiia bacterium]
MTVRIAMWSGPRNLSTALMRSWENREDTVVLDEPLYAHYLAVTGLDHPGRDEIIADGPVDAGEAIGRCLGRLPPGVAISYQKHMSHHLLPDLDRDWLDEVRNLLLIRHPVRVLASYTRVRDDVTLTDLGLPQQLELAERAELIIDAGDFLGDPERYQRAICAHLGIPFSPAMLRWRAGPRASDGRWARHWYAAVEASTGFAATADDGPGSDDPGRLPGHLHALAEEALGLYRTLAAGRLRL